MSQINFYHPVDSVDLISSVPESDYSPYNAPQFTLPTPPNTLLMWPSWLSHEVPVMKVKGPRITFSFNVSYRESE